MPSLLEDFVRCSAEHACPVCGSPKWCMISRDGKQAICQKVESKTEWGDAGYVHEVDGTPPPDVESIPAPKLSVDDIARLARQWEADLPEGKLFSLSRELGVSRNSLRRLGLGWRGDCYTFPMYDEWGDTVGARFRSVSGGQWSLKGGRNGLFAPKDYVGPRKLHVAEGPTDTAALLDMNLSAIGRACCMTNGQEVESLADSYATRQVVIVADADDPGIRGAKKLASRFKPGTVSVVVPTEHNDVREYYNQVGEAWYLVDASFGSSNRYWRSESV